MATETEEVDTMQALREAKKAAARHRAADRKADEARQAFRAAILTALDSGASMREVAAATGISPARVHQVRHGA